MEFYIMGFSSPNQGSASEKTASENRKVTLGSTMMSGYRASSG